MNREIKSVLKKTAKIAAVTCVSAGAVAVLTSATALKAIAEGGKHLANAVKDILNEQEQPQNIVEETEAEIVEETDTVSSDEAPAAEEI